MQKFKTILIGILCISSKSTLLFSHKLDKDLMKINK